MFMEGESDFILTSFSQRNLSALPITILYSISLYKIIPPAGNRIVIEFSDFKLEHTYQEYEDDYDYSDDEAVTPQDEASKCQFDYLTIEEDSGDNSIQPKKYCETMPKKINTTNVVTVKFVSFSNLSLFTVFFLGLKLT